MFGGLCYLVDDKMCVGIIKDDLMIRIDPQMEATALSKTGCRPMDFTGRPMKGYLYVDAGGYDDDSALSDWIDLCLDFNPRAKSSKKRKK